ncbi:MAG: cob(I)yrinic acid a,c-diamide adenosyltransferase [Rhizobiales bacterium]|nr:cob(I)yrinic acid a,c-diamide adenosyltransferase [Hyphomicrobiales bacterium]
MVRLNKIYTRTGDAGTAALGNGERRKKTDIRFVAIGEVDEANAAIGLARLHAHADLDRTLARVQNDLFDLGADLAVPEDGEKGRSRLRIAEAQVTRLEEEIDRWNADLAPLTSFVLPGGTALAAGLHLARTVTRRAERAVVALAGAEAVNPAAVAYVNRLSDLLFVAARFANDGGAGDVLWVPGENR